MEWYLIGFGYVSVNDCILSTTTSLQPDYYSYMQGIISTYILLANLSQRIFTGYSL